MNRKHIIILISCLGFGAADYFVTRFPNSTFAEFVQTNNTVLGLAVLIVFSVLFFARRRTDRQ